MDPNQDIFEELDTAMMEIFHRNHTLHNNFNNLSEHEQQRTLDEMADLVRQNSSNSSSSRRRTIRRFYEITWYWTYFPLVVLRFDRIWQQVTFTNFQRAISYGAFCFVKMIQTGFRSLIFLFVLQTYLHNVTNMIFVFSNIITFSTNFIKDLFTYIFQDSPNILHDNVMLVTHDYDMFYYLNSEEYQNALALQHLWLIFKNYRASLLRTSCITIKNGPSNCDLITNSLIYRMSDAISQSCPQFSTNTIRFITVTIYLLYAIIGNFICLNILFFLLYNIMRRIAGYAKIFKNLGLVIGSTFVDYIA